MRPAPAEDSIDVEIELLKSYVADDANEGDIVAASDLSGATLVVGDGCIEFGEFRLTPTRSHRSIGRAGKVVACIGWGASVEQTRASPEQDEFYYAEDVEVAMAKYGLRNIVKQCLLLRVKWEIEVAWHEAGCDDCFGSGFLDVSTVSDERKTCPCCDGTGWNDSARGHLARFKEAVSEKSK